MNTDAALAIRIEIITKFLKELYRANKTISIGEIVHQFDPSWTLLCDSELAAFLPNMQSDADCQGDVKYPISMDISLPTEPVGAWMSGKDNKAGIIIDSIRLRMMRTDTNKVIMDFMLTNLVANMSLSMNEYLYPVLSYNIEFQDAKVVERGILLKSERDIWQLSQL